MKSHRFCLSCNELPETGPPPFSWLRESASVHCNLLPFLQLRWMGSQRLRSGASFTTSNWVKFPHNHRFQTEMTPWATQEESRMPSLVPPPNCSACPGMVERPKWNPIILCIFPSTALGKLLSFFPRPIRNARLHQESQVSPQSNQGKDTSQCKGQSKGVFTPWKLYTGLWCPPLLLPQICTFPEHQRVMLIPALGLLSCSVCPVTLLQAVSILS